MANRSLGTLTVDLIAKVGGYTEGLSKADRETQKRMRAIRKSIDETVKTVKRWTAVGVATATAATAITVAIVNQSRRAIDEQAKLARSLDTTVKGLQITTRAGELNGVAFSQLEQFTKDLTRRLSQAAAGTGPAVDALDRLHLTAQELQALPLDQRIALIRERLDEFIPVAERAAVAGQLFGEEGSLNALRFTADSIARARREVDLYGVALSQVDASKIERANDALSSLSLIREGFSNQLTAELSTLLIAFSEGIADFVEQAGGLDDVVTELVDSIVIGAISVAGALAGPASTIQRIAKELWDGFRSLPPWVQEVGVVGAIFGGKYWRTALVGIAAVGNDVSAEIQFIRKRMEEGKSIFSAALFDADGEEFKEFRRQLEEAGKLVGEGPSLTDLALFGGGGENFDWSKWTEDAIAAYRDLQRQVESDAQPFVGPPVRGAQLPNVPGADANLPAQDPSVVAARAVKEWLNAGEQVEETLDDMSIYAEQAARNMQDALADFLFDPFDNGLEGMVKSFANTLQRLAAEAAAAEIFKALPLGEGGLGGFLSGIFSGGRAFGGPVLAGNAYQVGEYNRPELLYYGNRQYLIPGDNGRVEPMGGGGVTQIYNITTQNADSFRASERQIKRRARRGLIA